MNKVDVAVIGGGASGYFGAISIKTRQPKIDVIIFEKSQKLLSKVRISGGGRCNVTHHCAYTNQLIKNYPRGSSFLSKVFKEFSNNDTIEWFKSRGVSLKVESDNRIFPSSDSSESIIECFMKETTKLNIGIKTSYELKNIKKNEQGEFILHFENGQEYKAKKVLLAVGGFNKLKGYDFLANIGHNIITPKPSLFTFNIADNRLHQLMGVVSTNAHIKIIGLQEEATGPVLITHWGLSGPAVLKLSAWAARDLFDKNYIFTVKINWLNLNETQVRDQLFAFSKAHPKKLISSNALFSTSSRLWEYFCELAEIDENLKWLEISKRSFNKLVEALVNSQYLVNGKTTFKEEFVTCGGVDLLEVSSSTLESRIVSGLFLAGEVLDIDGITGGFNFQNAWSTAWVAGKSIAESL